MSPNYDLVIKGATVVTEGGPRQCDIGITGERIAALGEALEGTEVVDASGLIALPGGVDSHCHIDQVDPQNGHGAESMISGTRAALAGGTTSIISFISQHAGEEIADVFAESLRRGETSLADYTFHQIISDPTDKVVLEDIPMVVAAGIRSLKVFLTYEDAHLTDREFLRVLAAAHREGCMVTVHCENYDAIGFLTEQLLAQGMVEPKYHAWSRPEVVEREATYRTICLAELVDTPIQIFHVSCHEVAEEIERAQKRGLKVWGETCPQYIVLGAKDMDRPGREGAKYMCSPAPRDPANVEPFWDDIRRGVIDVISSDHSAFFFSGPKNSKEVNGTDADFSQIPNGVPGVGSRMPLVFSEGVSKGRIDLETFARLTATNPARIFGLYPKKGAIGVGSDADIVLWDANRKVTITNALLQHAVDYTPYEGMEVTGWPVATYLRGKLSMKDGVVCAEPGQGQFLKREAYELATPRGITPNGFNAAKLPPQEKK
ncbi:dihydropyrimidinase [Rhodobacter aestuarii]|uniref:Dihydropyrimidinase n=1 Tax=Rhodobacter aestuarii TaxID=453582 RepID=A0A1N7JUD4_9RHOB|nr:dihydropyrimidinase [Rhodobacter aestuarii]PTV95985.1 dihydropyrimidinase [Rhodobacter aestuarii]SIS52953.1 dihydropyrimidinase [Rhodobacter aestuarii]